MIPQKGIHMKNKNQSDEYLVHLIRNGNKEAYETLYFRYNRLSMILAIDFYRSNYLPGLTVDDFYSIYSCNYFTALRNFNDKIGKFKAYWKQISFHEIVKMVKENAKHYQPGNVSLNQKIDIESETLMEEIIGRDDESVSIRLEAEKVIEHIKESDSSILTDEERDVFLARSFGLSYKEIANNRNSDLKHIRYIYSRACKKLAEISHFK